MKRTKQGLSNTYFNFDGAATGKEPCIDMQDFYIQDLGMERNREFEHQSRDLINLSLLYEESTTKRCEI